MDISLRQKPVVTRLADSFDQTKKKPTCAVDKKTYGAKNAEANDQKFHFCLRLCERDLIDTLQLHCNKVKQQKTASLQGRGFGLDRGFV